MSARSSTDGAALSQGTRQGGHVVEMQRRRLLHAIGEVVGEDGCEAATVGRVCEQAGTSRRTFYELFADREECLLATFEAQVERLAESVLPAYARAGRWVARLRGALTLLLEGLDAEPDSARMCIVESLRAGPRLVEYRQTVLEVLTHVVEEGCAETRSGSEPPPLTAQGIVGGVLSVVHARLLSPSTSDDGAPHSLVELAGPLMAMIVYPYLGPAAARKELERPAPTTGPPTVRSGADPFKGLPIRFTYRTARVLSTIAADPGASNRHIAEIAGVTDQGQMSRLLRRLCSCELIENSGQGQAMGEPNAWTLTPRGHSIHAAIAGEHTAQ